MAEDYRRYSENRDVGCNNYAVPMDVEEESFPEIPFYFVEKYGHDVVRILRTVKEHILLEKDVDWKLLHQLVTLLIFDRKTLPYCVEFLTEIVKLLEKYSCREIDLAVEILKTIYFSVHECIIKRLPNRMEGFSIYCNEPTLFDIKKQRLNFHNCATYKDYADVDFVWVTASCANVGLLKLMLKFGMEMLGPKNFEVIGRQEYEYVVGNLGLFYDKYEGENYRYAVKKYDTYCKNMPRKKLFLIIRALDILLKMVLARKYRENYILCYKLIFDSIAEPYVSSTKVKSFLQNILPRAMSDGITEIVENFRSLLPEVPEMPEPRTLRHLCRIQIRQKLRQNMNMPFGVSSLMLPNKLKKYILLNDDCDYSNIIASFFIPRFVANCALHSIQLPKSTLDIPNTRDTSFNIHCYFLEYIGSM